MGRVAELAEPTTYRFVAIAAERGIAWFNKAAGPSNCNPARAHVHLHLPIEDVLAKLADE
jgi:hypothetical protein